MTLLTDTWIWGFGVAPRNQHFKKSFFRPLGISVQVISSSPHGLHMAFLYEHQSQDLGPILIQFELNLSNYILKCPIPKKSHFEIPVRHELWWYTSEPNILPKLDFENCSFTS